MKNVSKDGTREIELQRRTETSQKRKRKKKSRLNFLCVDQPRRVMGEEGQAAVEV